MIRRKPTQIEMKQEDRIEYEELREQLYVFNFFLSLYFENLKFLIILNIFELIIAFFLIGKTKTS